jgi:hypothetical protein
LLLSPLSYKRLRKTICSREDRLIEPSEGISETKGSV